MSLQGLSRLVGPVSVAAAALMIAEPNAEPGAGSCAGCPIGQQPATHPEIRVGAVRHVRPATCADRHLPPASRRSGKAGPRRIPDRIPRHVAPSPETGGSRASSRRRLLPSRRRSCRAQSPARWPSARPRRSGCSQSAGPSSLIATFRANVFPRPAAALLILGGLVGILAGSTPYQVPLALAVGWIGISLLRAHQTRVYVSAPSPAG